MKTTMTNEFVTLKTFKKSMKNIDQRFESIDKRFLEVDKRFEAVDKRFDNMEVLIRQEVKRVDDNSNERFNIFMEEVRENFKALMEHPVFANHKA
jgi:hypothetical protein